MDDGYVFDPPLGELRRNQVRLFYKTDSQNTLGHWIFDIDSSKNRTKLIFVPLALRVTAEMTILQLREHVADLTGTVFLENIVLVRLRSVSKIYVYICWSEIFH